MAGGSLKVLKGVESEAWGDQVHMINTEPGVVAALGIGKE
jgi:hypothetical protein